MSVISISTNSLVNNPPFIGASLSGGVSREFTQKIPVLGSTIVSADNANLTAGSVLTIGSIPNLTDVAIYCVIHQGKPIRGKLTITYQIGGVNNTLDFLPKAEIVTIGLFCDGTTIKTVSLTNNTNVTFSATLQRAALSTLEEAPGDGIDFVEALKANILVNQPLPPDIQSVVGPL